MFSLWVSLKGKTLSYVVLRGARAFVGCIGGNRLCLPGTQARSPPHPLSDPCLRGSGPNLAAPTWNETQEHDGKG